MSLPNPPFVKKFDFRGKYGTDITDEDAYYLALALTQIVPTKKLLLGWDTRKSSKNLALNFIHALRDTDIEIHYLDKVPIDYVTVAANAFDFDLSVMFTGSHNTWEWTGMLIHTQKGESLQGELVKRVVEKFHAAKSTQYEAPETDLSSHHNFLGTVEKVYAQKIKELIPTSEIRPLRVVVDLGDGSGSKALSVLETVFPQVEFTRLNDRGVYDADTPHQADPSDHKNMQQVIDAVQNTRFDCGFAFDSDADRVLAIDEKGAYLNGSVLGGALVDCFAMLGLSTQKVGYAVEVGPSLYNSIVDLNKTLSEKVDATAIPVGRSIVRQMIFEEQIDVGIENVGHFYCKDFFHTDSGTFMIAVVLYWVSHNGTLSKLTRRHPDGKRVQGSVPLGESNGTQFEKLSQELQNHFDGKSLKEISVDGQRVEVLDDEFMQSWWSMRKSGYEPIEKFYYGSTDEKDFEYMDERFKKLPH